MLATKIPAVMRAITFVLACIALASRARRVKTSLEQAQGSSNDKGEGSQWLVDKHTGSVSSLAEVKRSLLQQNVESLSPFRKLALVLLALNPASGLQLPGASRSLATMQRRHYGQAPVRSGSHERVVMQASGDESNLESSSDLTESRSADKAKPYANFPEFNAAGVTQGATVADDDAPIAPVDAWQPQAIADSEKEGSDDMWQAELDKALLDKALLDKALLSGMCELYDEVMPELCDADVEVSERMELMKAALNDPIFLEDVRVKLSTSRDNGSMDPALIEKLFPQGSESRADLVWLMALQKHVPAAFEQLGKKVKKQVQEQENEEQRELKEEASELLRSVPNGLETPSYEVVLVLEVPNILSKPCPIEIRDYEAFTVAQTNMKEGAGSATEGAGFNALAAYHFGQNQPKTVMAMTVPVDITSSADNSKASMSFVLPQELADTPPTPLEGSAVEIVEVPSRIVAVKAFGGLVTEEEVEHQKAVLLEALAMDGNYSPVDAGQVSVLRYTDMKMSGVDREYEAESVVSTQAVQPANWQQFAIWRRSNEVAIVVTKTTVGDVK